MNPPILAYSQTKHMNRRWFVDQATIYPIAWSLCLGCVLFKYYSLAATQFSLTHGSQAVKQCILGENFLYISCLKVSNIFIILYTNT